MLQLLLHGIGDYLIQNDAMALNKKKSGWLGFFACLIHCVTYTVPFLLIATPKQALFIFVTHFIIDRWHLVDYFLALRNWVWVKESDCLYLPESATLDISNFGFSKDRPFAISIWLYIITDNIFHLICNYLALTYL